MARVFVGGLSWSTDNLLLRVTFEVYGKVVDAEVIRDRINNHSRGFGFVEFTDAESAQKAIDVLNDSILDGRKIVVNLAREKGKTWGG